MEIKHFLSVLDDLGADFYTGIPDSLLNPLCDYIMSKYGICDKHIVAANEGAAVGLAAGHYLATSKPAVVYMQNSGIGNAINPICSLLHKKVYAIPVIFIIGWRGEPGTKDEPQHVFQGEVTLPILDCLEIPYVVISKETEYKELMLHVELFRNHIENGQAVAFVVKSGALQSSIKMKYDSNEKMSREQILRLIMESSQSDDVFICTTGKLSREVFEIREQEGAGHGRDFLTVGSMGHSLMIALGVALTKPKKRILCLDGDGAAIMHLGSMAVTGVHHPKNLVHVVINNGAYESVGGMPVVSTHLKLFETALTLGYRHSFHVRDEEELLTILSKIIDFEGPIFIEIMSNLESRGNLSRPNVTPIHNKNEFMNFLSEGN